MRNLHFTLSAALLIAIGLIPSFAGSQGQYPAYSGNKRIAVMMLAWQDRACPDTRQNVVNKIWNNSQSLRKYYLDMSRNAMDFALPADAAQDGTVPATTSNVYGPYTLTIAEGFDKDITYANVESYYGSTGTPYLDGAFPVARDLAATRDGFNASNYDYIMYVTPKGPSTGSVGGYAGVDATYSHLYVMKQNYINHELGHNLGLAHSNTTVDKDGYGSQDCVMGNQNNPHLDSVHTYNMGWYPDASFSIKSFGQYTIENLAQPDTDNVKVLRFDRAAHGATSNSTYNVWVSYRVQGIGQDIGLNTNWDKKVNIHYCKADSNRPSDPGGSYSRYYTNNNVTQFLTGGNYTDPDNLCTVRYLREDSSGNASAVVQLIDPSGNQPPSISAGQTISLSPGTSTFSIQANDPENDTLSFTIVSVPAQGTLTVSGNTFTYDATTSGTYTFTVRANDGQYDSYDEAVTISIVGLTPPTADAGPDQTVVIQEGVLWTPASMITGLWLDAADASSTSLNGSSITTWSDKSGNSRNASQATASAQPTLTSGGMNGLDILTFDGSTDFLNVDLDFLAGVSHSAFIVAKTTAYNNIYGAANKGAGAGSLHVGFRNGSEYRMNYWGNDWFKSIGTEFVAGNSNILNYVWTSGTSKEIYANGVSQGASASAGVIAAMAGGGRISNIVGQGFYGGDLAEIVMITGSLSLDDRQKMEGYLAHKWGLTANLPVAHPYKSAPPGATGAVADLAGSVSDVDNDPLTSSWSVVSGPGEVTFGNDTIPATTAFFTVTGTYVLSLTTTDGLTPVSDEMIVTVTDSSGNSAPTAVAVAPTSVTDTDGNGSENVTLDGSGSTDADGTITSYVWSEGGSQIATGVTATLPLTVGTHTITLTVTDDAGATGTDTTVIEVIAVNQAPTVTATATPNPVTLSAGTGGGDPVAGAYLEWDAALDAAGDATWSSSTANSYTWTFDGGNLSPDAVADARFTTLTHAYAFPAAKDASNNNWNGYDSNKPATWEFVIDVDGTDGSIFETGATGDGMQVDIVNGVLRGTVEEDPTEARVSYPLTAEDMGRFIHVVFVADNINNVVQLYVDGDLKDSQPWTAGEDWSGTDAAALGSSSGIGKVPDGGSTTDFTGKMALFRFYRNTAFSAAEVTTNFSSLSGGSSATVNLDGTVVDPDGPTLTTSWTVVSTTPAGLSVQFADASAIDTTATFVEAGEYTLRLTADDSIASNYAEVTITVNDPNPTNQAPTALAVATTPVTDTDGNGSEDVTLDGNGSSDADGTITSYVWSEGGSQIATGVTATLPLTVGTHTITLTVTDDDGATATDTVTVTVEEQILTNTPPVAVPALSAPAAPVAGDTVTLSGSASYDPDGDAIVFYQWVQLAGPAVTLDETDPIHPTFVAVVAGTYLFELTVSDGDLTGTDTVEIIINAAPNTAPVIDVAPMATDNPVTLPNTTTVSVSASDADGDQLTYTWSKVTNDGTVTFTPNGTSTSNVATASFSVAGSYVLQVAVSDGNNPAVTQSFSVEVLDESIPTDVVIPAEADSFTSKRSSGSNYGTLPYLEVTGNGRSTRNSFMRFDLGTLASSTTNATLRIYTYGNSTPVSLNFYTVEDDSWEESTITWKTMPARSTTALVTAASINGGYVEVDLTAAVQQQTDGKITVCIDASGSYTIASREAADSTQHPALIITTQ